MRGPNQGTSVGLGPTNPRTAESHSIILANENCLKSYAVPKNLSEIALL